MKTVLESPSRVAVACAGCVLSLSAPGSVRAQAAALAQPTIVVTANRTDLRADEALADVVVIDRAMLDAQSGRTVPEILTRLAGVQISANGGPGTASSVFVRGAEGRHTLLLIDGVRYGSATLGAPSWDNLSLESIERIEVVKGPASAIFGANALGGVVNIITRRAQPGLQSSARLTIGQGQHRALAASVGGAVGVFSHRLDVSHLGEANGSVTNSSAPFGAHDPDRDGFRQLSASGSLGWQLSRDWRLDAHLAGSQGRVRYDQGPGMDDRAALRAEGLRVKLNGRLSPGWKTHITFGQTTDRSADIVSSYGESVFETRQRQFTWQNDLQTPAGELALGVEHLSQKVDSTTAFDATSRNINGVFAALVGRAGAHTWQANLRRDSNGQFGSAATGALAYGVQFTPAWQLSASAGTSFVAPSFNDLYFPNFSNPLLNRERGRNVEMGLRWRQAGQSVQLRAFNNRLRDLIGLDANFAVVNINRAQLSGWSLAYEGHALGLNWRAEAQGLNTRNEITGKQLARRAKSQVTLSVNGTSGAWRYGASLLNVGKRFDNAANTVALPGYNTLDVNLGYRFSPLWSLDAKLNNALNERYETARGYNQSGRQFLLTVNASF